MFLGNLTKDVDAGLERSRFDSNVKRSDDVETADVWGNVLFEENGGVGGHGRRGAAHVNAHDLTRGLVNVDGTAHAFLVVDAAESKIGIKTAVGVIHGNDVRGKLPRRGYVGLDGRGNCVCNEVLDGAPFGNVVSEVANDGATLPDGRDVEKTNVARKGNVVLHSRMLNVYLAPRVRVTKTSSSGKSAKAKRTWAGSMSQRPPR